LDENSFPGGAVKFFNFQVLLDPCEKAFDLVPPAIEFSYLVKKPGDHPGRSGTGGGFRQ